MATNLYLVNLSDRLADLVQTFSETMEQAPGAVIASLLTDWLAHNDILFRYFGPGSLTCPLLKDENGEQILGAKLHTILLEAHRQAIIGNEFSMQRARAYNKEVRESLKECHGEDRQQ